MAAAEHTAGLLQALHKGKLVAERLRPVLAPCPAHTLAAAFALLDVRGAAQRAIDVFRVLRALPLSDPLSSLCTTATYDSIIALTPSSARGVSTAQHLLLEMRTRGVARSVASYSAALAVCVRADRCEAALQLHGDMRGDGLAPDVPALQALMDAYGQLRLWEDALDNLDAIVAKGVRAEWCYNMALTACGRAGRAAEAVGVFDRMMTSGLQPTLATYTALLSLFCRAGAVAEAAHVLEGIKAAGLQPNTIIYSSLINGCEKAGSLQEALRYFDEMLAVGCRPSVVTFNTLLRACARARAWRLSVHLWSYMLDCGLHPDIVSVRAWITAMHASGCWPGVLLVLQQRLPRAVGKDPILQGKLCEALWSAGSTQSRCAALAMPGARVNMSRVEHTVRPADAVSPSSSAGSGPPAQAPPSGDGPPAVVSSWSVSAQQPGPAVACVALWLHCLLTSYDFQVHTLSVAAVWGPVAAQSAAETLVRRHTAGAAHTCLSPRKPGLTAERLGRRETAPAAVHAPFPTSQQSSPQRASPQRASPRRDPLSRSSASFPALGLSDAHADEDVIAALSRLANPPPLTVERAAHSGGSGYHHPDQYVLPLRDQTRPAMMPPPGRLRGSTPAAPPHGAQILQLTLDLSQQEHMRGAVAATVAAAIQQHGWPLWLQVQGCMLRVSCSREELAHWRASGASVLGVPLPDPLESQRAPHAVSGFLEEWEDAEGLLHAAQARDDAWEAPPPAPAPEWPEAAAVVAGAAKALGLPPRAVVRALQILTHLLAPDVLPRRAAEHAVVPQFPPPAPVPAPQLAQHAQQGPQGMQIAQLIDSLRAVQLRDPLPANSSPPVQLPAAGTSRPQGPPDARGLGPLPSAAAVQLDPRSMHGHHAAARHLPESQLELSASASLPLPEGAGARQWALDSADYGSRAADYGPDCYATTSHSGSAQTTATSTSAPSTEGPPSGGTGAAWRPPFPMRRDDSMPVGAGGESGGAWSGNPRRAQLISSFCIAHGAATAGQLLSELWPPAEVRPAGDAVGVSIALPPSIWQYYDLYLGLTDSVPSATRTALERFRELHVEKLACAPTLHQLPPSLVAAAAFTCARRCLDISPEWPQVLTGTTGQALVRPHGGDGGSVDTPLAAACVLVAETLRLPPFEPTAYQQVLAEGLNGMLRMEKRQTVTESNVSPEELQCVLVRACEMRAGAAARAVSTALAIGGANI